MKFCTGQLYFRKIIRVMWGAVAWTSLLIPAQAAPSSTSSFEFRLGYTVFDGVNLQTVEFKARTISLSSDSVGAWTPMDQPVGNAGISLRHLQVPGVTISISVLAAEWASEDQGIWTRFIVSSQEQLGEGTTLSGKVDSADGPPALRLFGWRTREFVLTQAATVGEPARAHLHVHATDGKRALLFVLSGNADAIVARRDDFWSFISRLAVQ